MVSLSNLLHILDLTPSGAYINGPCLLRIGGETRGFKRNTLITRTGTGTSGSFSETSGLI